MQNNSNRYGRQSDQDDAQSATQMKRIDGSIEPCEIGQRIDQQIQVRKSLSGTQNIVF